MGKSNCPHCGERLHRPRGRPPKKPRIVNGVETWLCPCCSKWKRAHEFGVSRSAKNGLSSWCLECKRFDRGIYR
jgi:hypothetical protein